MSEAPSPLPPGASAASNDGNSSNPLDWRVSVQQSYRNTEVREIAKVLAALEPGATSGSKLRLAMQFEDAVFKQATSLADYRKRLTKRLKKVQKSYVPTTAKANAHSTTGTQSTHGTAGASGATAASASISSRSDKASVLQQLRSKYGDAILYILKHADTAYQQMRLKHGSDKANQLRQHTDGVQQWAADLGLALETSNTEGGGSGQQQQQQQQQPQLNLKISDSDLEKLKTHLERRTENIRSHVVKLADPDRFMLEALEKTEKDISEKPSASKLLAVTLKRRFEQLSSRTAAPTVTVDGLAMLQQALETVNKSVPLPTRNQRNDTQAALIHLEKIRASSSLLLAWSLIPDKKKPIASNNSTNTNTTTASNNINTNINTLNVLTKAHACVNEGIELVSKVMQELRKGQQRKGVTLEDAWMKTLTLPLTSAGGVGGGGGVGVGGGGGISSGIDALESSSTTAGSSSSTNENNNNGLPQVMSSSSSSYKRPIVRTRVLLNKGRKPPSNLLSALQRKRAKLVRPHPQGEGSHLILEFGDAFTMTIYFVPLLVTLRAQDNRDRQQHQEEEEDDGDEQRQQASKKAKIAATKNDSSNHDDATKDAGMSASTAKWDSDDYFDINRNPEFVGCASLTPLSHGLYDHHNRDDKKKGEEDLSSSSSSSSLVRVWGATGTVDLLGRVVEERLRDASAHATHILRKCFETTLAAKDNYHHHAGGSNSSISNDFEIELLEATALLEFIQIARTTYMPDWQDAEAP